LGTLTVQEQLIYSAQLRLPESVPFTQIKEIVANVITELRLNHVKDTLIGNSSVRGLSGGERRRVLIATELVTYPKILLLDEPTSGLDSYNATIVMQILKDLAEKRNCSIVCSIHQPRSAIYQMFDSLVLLWNGYTVYYGSAVEAPQFFAQNGYKCPKYENPGDFMISALNEEPDEALTALVNSYEQWTQNLATRKAQLQVTKSDESGSGSSSVQVRGLVFDSSTILVFNVLLQSSSSSTAPEIDNDLPNKEILVTLHNNSNARLSESIAKSGNLTSETSVDMEKRST
jgi:ABC-type multidrug transport system ATPase subunit